MPKSNRPRRNNYCHLSVVEPTTSALSEIEAARRGIEMIRADIANLLELVDAVDGLLGEPADVVA